MQCRASIVLYHTPHQEVAHVSSLLYDSGVVDEVQLVDNGKGNNIGYGRGHNIALRESQKKGATYHLVMNSDLDFQPEDLKKLIHYMDEHPDVALIQPKIIYPNGAFQPCARLLPSPMDVFSRRFLPDSWNQERLEKYELHKSSYKHIMNIPNLSGCFMLLRMSALEEVGLFDERYFMYMEDMDLTRRLHAKYKTIMYPMVTISHRHTKASYHNLKMMCVHVISACKYFNKWGWYFDAERKDFNQQIQLEIDQQELE